MPVRRSCSGILQMAWMRKVLYGLIHFEEGKDCQRRILFICLFISNRGILINADVNAAYQIMKAGGYQEIPIKEKEKVVRLNVA